LRRALDDDVDCLFGQLSVKDFEELGGCLEFLLFRHRVEQDRKVIVVVVTNRNAPEGEIFSINSVERVRNLGLDDVLEAADCLDGLDFDRERVGGGLSVDETEKGQKVVVHGVAKHQVKRRVRGAVRVRSEG